MTYYEKKGDKKNASDCYNSVANLYGRQGNQKKELEYQTKALNAKIELGDQNGISASYINLGNFYGRQKIYDTSLIYYFKGLKITEETHNQKFKLNALGNIGTVYVQLGKTKEALEYLMKCYDIASQMGDKEAQVTTLNTIGGCYSEIGDQKKALVYINQALALAEDIKSAIEIRASYQNLADVYQKLGDYKHAYDYHVKYTNISDTILNAENSKQINEMTAKYETDKKEQEIALLNKNQEIQEANSKKQQIIIWAVCGGLFIMFILSFFIFRQYKQKQKANTALESAYHEIEEKNKDITDSINYAKRIQTAILPSIETIHTYLPESFVFYQPKDIVSGDFYWFNEKNNKCIIAVADCTGHGVPGAFMSMIGNDFLTQIVIEKGITQPNLILTHLHDGVKNALKQDASSSETKDGMDIAIITLEEKNGKYLLEFAGALRPLWIISKTKNEVDELKGDKHSIGGAYSADQRNFIHHSLEIQKGDSLFMSTDGFGDQFGGEFGKKFMTKNMKELLLSIRTKSMAEQKIELDKSLGNWKQDRQQIDDILVIWIRI